MGKLDDYKNWVKRILGRKEDADVEHPNEFAWMDEDENSGREETPRLFWYNPSEAGERNEDDSRYLFVPRPTEGGKDWEYIPTAEANTPIPHSEGLFGQDWSGEEGGAWKNKPVDPRFMEEIMKPPGESFAFAPLTDEEEKIKWPNMQNDSAVNKLLKATNDKKHWTEDLPTSTHDAISEFLSDELTPGSTPFNPLPPDSDEEFKFNSYGEQIGGPVDEPNPQWDNYAQGSAAHSVAVDQGWGGTEPDISNYSEEGIYSGENNSAHDVKTFAEGFLGTHGLSLTDANGEPIQDIFNYHGIKTGETPVTSQHITDYVRSTVGQTDPFNQPPSAVDKLLKANPFLQKRKKKADRQGKVPKIDKPKDLTQANLPKKIKVPKQPTVTPDSVPEVVPPPQPETIDPHTYNLKGFGKGSSTLPPAVRGVPYFPPSRPGEEDSIQNMHNFRMERNGEWQNLRLIPENQNLSREQKIDIERQHNEESDALMDKQWEAHRQIYPVIDSTGHFTEEDWRKNYEEWGQDGQENWEELFEELKGDEGHLWAKWGDSSISKLLKATEKDRNFLQEYLARIASDKSGSEYHNYGENISPHASIAIAGKGVRDDWMGEEVDYTELPNPKDFRSPSELRHTDPELPHTKKRGKEPNVQNSALDKLLKAVGTPPPEGMDEEELDRVFREMMMEEYGRVLSQQEWLDMKADEKTKGERADEVLQKPTKPHNWLDYWSRQEVGSEPEFTGGQTIHPSTRDMMEMTESDKWKKLKPWEQRGLSSEEVIPEPGKMPPNIQNTALDKLLKAIDSNIEDPSKDYWHSVGEGTQHPFTRFGPTFLGDEGGIGAWSTEAGEIGSQPWEFAIADYSGASMDKYWENIKNILEHQAQMDKTSGKDPAINPESKLENMQTDGNSSVLWEQFNRKEGM